MLLVKTEVRPSPIAGLGLFALEPIKKGQVRWRLDESVDLILNPKHILACGAEFKKHLMTYAYISKGHAHGMLVLCCDNERFVNHSENPNSITVGDTSIAARDIAVGEEITENYRDFCEDWKSRFPWIEPLEMALGA